MTMAARDFNTVISLIGLCLTFLSFISADPADSSCPGPTMYYKEVGCTPVFKNPDDPCPEKYNCDHLKNLPTDKCILNGREYAIGEIPRDEDKNPCDIACRCSTRFGGPKFDCAIVDCFDQPGCYEKKNATSCCGDLACPKKPEDVPTCMVDGKIYKDGQYFVPASEPEKDCYCGEGYTGENIEPFCAIRKDSRCRDMFYHINDIRGNCVPTYYYGQSLTSGCSIGYRCQNDKDAVIPRTSDDAKSSTTEPADPGMTCTFGNLKMRVGDELKQGTGYSSVCLKCVCEVPPVPTCQQLSEAECIKARREFLTTQAPIPLRK